MTKSCKLCAHFRKLRKMPIHFKGTLKNFLVESIKLMSKSLLNLMNIIFLNVMNVRDKCLFVLNIDTASILL